MKIQAIFMDRDGTIGGTGHFIHPNDFKPYKNFYKAVELLREHNIKIFGFTNQHRIASKEVELQDFVREFNGYGFDDSYICPHEIGGDCDCHKPKPGMLLQAAREYSLDLTKCVVIGDVGTDMIAANEVNAIKILVKTGWGEGSLGEYRYKWIDVDPDYVAIDVLDAVRWLLSSYL